MKSRFLCMIAFLLMAGTMSAQTHYTPNAHAYDNNMPIVATVTMDGNDITTGELGAFIGDEVRGSALVQPTLDNTYWIQVYFDSENESDATISFKYYNDGTEYDVTTTVDVDPEGDGTAGEPVVLAITTTTTQTMAMATGWNWWSTPIEMNNVDGLTMLENSLGADGYMIRNRSGLSVDYDTDWQMWWGDEFAITNEEMYEIKMTNAKSATFSGSLANPSSHPISINPGWNWIGYPKNTSMGVDAAFTSLTSVDDDIIQARNGDYSIYVTGFGFWGDVEYVNPGNGYKYKYVGTTPQTFTYPSNNRFDSNVQVGDVAYSPESTKYQYLMNVIASVELNESEINSDGYVVNALCNGESRGHARLRYCELTGQYVALLTIFSDDSDNVYFQLEDVDNNLVYLGNETVQFESELVLGSLKNPYPIRFGNTGVNEYMLTTNIYPNPSEKGRLVSVEMNGYSNANGTCFVELFNSLGERVATEVSTANPVVIKSPSVVGVYMLRVTCNGKCYYGKLVVE